MDFNAKAINWDSERRVARAKIIAGEIIKTIPVKQYGRALEFGCGTGLISFNLIDKFEHITLVDTSRGMIETLNSKIQDFKLKNMSAFQTDINNDDSIPGEFDVVYTSMALHHIADTETTLKNLYKQLKTGGYLCIVELNEDDGSFHKEEADFNGHNGFDQKTLKKTAEEIGFRNVATNTFYHDHKVIDGSKVDYSLFLMVGEK